MPRAAIEDKIIATVEAEAPPPVAT